MSVMLDAQQHIPAAERSAMQSIGSARNTLGAQLAFSLGSRAGPGKSGGSPDWGGYRSEDAPCC